MANNQFIIAIISILLPLAIQGATTNTTTTTTTTTNPAYEVATGYDDRYDDRYGDRYGDDQAIVVVEGKVYCQTCRNYGPWSLSGADPIRGARVRVICKNYKKRVSYYKAFSTDRAGYFYAELKGYKMSHKLLDHPLHACYVRLLTSPDERCNLVSNENNGMKGARLRFEDKVLYGRNYELTVIYAAGPLAFRPSDCYPDKKTAP